MATSLLVWEAVQARLPSSNAPGFAIEEGTNVPLDGLDFDKDTNESCVFRGTIPQQYTAVADVEVAIYWATDGVSTGNVVWQVEFLATSDGEDRDGSLSSASTVTDSRLAADETHIATITLSSPGLAPGDRFKIKVTRVATSGSDTYNGDARLEGIEVRES